MRHEPRKPTASTSANAAGALGIAVAIFACICWAVGQMGMTVFFGVLAALLLMKWFAGEVAFEIAMQQYRANKAEYDEQAEVTRMNKAIHDAQARTEYAVNPLKAPQARKPVSV